MAKKKEASSEESMETFVNDICRECLKYQQFGKACWVYWDKKKDCSMRVTDHIEWQQQNLMLK